jgi:hypothetical protein
VKRARQSEIFNILLAQSRKAEAEGRMEEVWIRHDEYGGWGGAHTPWESYGLKSRGLKPDGLCDKFGKCQPMSRESGLETVKILKDCNDKEALRIFAILKANGIWLFHKETQTWRGKFYPDMPTMKDKVKKDNSLTPKQKHYLKRYGSMEWVDLVSMARFSRFHRSWFRRRRQTALLDQRSREIVRSESTTGRTPINCRSFVAVGTLWFSIKAVSRKGLFEFASPDQKPGNQSASAFVRSAEI